MTVRTRRNGGSFIFGAIFPHPTNDILFFATAMFGWFGILVAEGFGADFVGEFVAGVFEGAPQVPAGDGAVGTPAFAEFEQFFWFGHVLFSVGHGPAFFYGEVVDGKYVRAAQTKNQKHFHRPGADAADGDQSFDEFFVGKF